MKRLLTTLALGAGLAAGAMAATVTIPTQPGQYIDWSSASLTNCNVENGGANIGSTHRGSKAVFTLEADNAMDYVLTFASGAQGLEAVVNMDISNAGGTSLWNQDFDIANTGSWSTTELHTAQTGKLEAGTLMLTMTVTSTTGSYAGNFGQLALLTMDDYYASYPQVPSDEYLPLQSGAYTHYSTTGPNVPTYEGGGSNIGYLKDGGMAEYTFYCAQKAYYDLTLGITTYSGGQIVAAVVDATTGETEAGGTFEIPSSANYDAQSFAIEQVITKGVKTLRLTFTADHTNWIMNYRDVTLTKRADAADAGPRFSVSVTQNIAEAGDVAKTPASQEIEQGSNVRFTATPRFGYHFIRWTDAQGTELSTANPYTTRVQADMEVVAVFEAVPTYELSLDIVGGYDHMLTLSPQPTVVGGRKMYEGGTVVTLTASQNDAVRFAHWSNGVTDMTTTVTMDGDQTLTATYAQGDYLAAWDFHDTSKGGSYTPDFASSEDNEQASLYLRNFNTGLVDGRSMWVRDNNCAVIWGEPVDYAYELSLNTTNFTDIRLRVNLWFSYVYWSQLVGQWSLDATTWHTIGDPVAIQSSATQYVWTLPAECEHQAKVLFRFMPLTDSELVKTGESTYRPLWMSELYVFGQPSTYDDGTAPVLVGTVPAEGASGASATGRIVLTFDEKVRLTDGASATLGGQPIEGTAAGSLVTFPYTGLAYGTTYTFTLAAGSVADQGGNALAEPVTLTFTTMERPAVAKRPFDFVVGVDGDADAAFAAANAQSSDRFRIFVPNGEYLLTGNSDYSMTYVYRTVSVIGQDRDKTRLYNTPAGYGISSCSTLDLHDGGDNYLQDIALENRRGVDGGQAAALHESTERNVYKHVSLIGNQDTYVSGNREYFEDCLIAGSVDFICGGGDIWFEQCDLRITRSGSVLTAPATAANQPWGYVFNRCTVDAYEGLVYNQDGTSQYVEAGDGSYNLGRPWQNSPASTFLYTQLNILPGAAGWQNMSAGKVCRFHEYGSVNARGTALDLSTRSIASCQPAEGSDAPVLTADEAARYTLQAVLGSERDGWVPTLHTEQCAAPAVSLEGDVLSWADDAYASCYVIFRDDVYVANVTEPTFTVDEPGAYTVRSANERGGLGEASAAVAYEPAVAIEQVAAPAPTAAQAYDLMGRPVARQAHGLSIAGGRKTLVK